jgi:hypothetical protein
MDRQRRDPDILEPARQVDDRHVRLGSPADPRLHRHREIDRGDDLARHLDHRHRIAKPAGARATVRDLRDPAAAVEIEERRPRSRRHHRRAPQQLGIGTIDLDRGRPIIGLEGRPALRDDRVDEDLLRADELGHAQRRPDRPADPPEHAIGDVLHRREDDRAVREHLHAAQYSG